MSRDTAALPVVRHAYAHVPFCHRICPYCSFYKHTPGSTDLGAFVEALLAEARSRASLCQLELETLYFGGGTPTMLSETHLERLLSGLGEIMDLQGLSEFTVEANPRTLPPGKAELLRRHGVTRVSLGAQAWDAATLATLGRDHTPAEAAETFRTLRAAGFDSVNIDLMFSIPGQSLEVWGDSLRRTLEVAPDHISTYNLNYEEDTEFFERLRAGRYQETPEQDAEFFFTALDLLGQAGFEHYEISNHARPGHESRHNAAYWFGCDYLGLGPGATSTVAGRRWQNARDTTRYIELARAGLDTAFEQEQLNDEQRRTERFGLELRTRQGLPEALIAPAQQVLLRQLAADGLLEISEGRVRLLRLGKPLADSIAVALLG